MSKNGMAKSIANVLVNEAKIDIIDRILGDHDTTEDPETTKQNIISKLMTKSNTEVWELYREHCQKLIVDKTPPAYESYKLEAQLIYAIL